MTENKRFDLTFNQNDQWDIIDKLESEQKNAICIYNDLGQTCFSSAPQVCELMNELHEEKEIAIEGIKIADELIKKYGGEELKHEWKKEVTVKYR